MKIFLRSFFAALAVASSIAVFAQVWEKSIAPGVSYRMEMDVMAPRLLHVLRINPKAPKLRLEAEVAGGKVFGNSEEKGRESLSAMVQRRGAIAAINADFFPWSGDPLGAMVVNDRLFSIPDPRRATFAWGEGVTRFTKLVWSGKLSIPKWADLEIGGLNEEAKDDAITVYTDAAAVVIAKQPSIMLVCDVAKGATFGPNTKETVTVAQVIADQSLMKVEPGKVVIAARGAKVEELKALQVGSSLGIGWATGGLDFTKIHNVVGGGPFLVRQSKPFIDFKDSGFGEKFATDRHPRSAVGVTKEGDIMLVATDGRQKMSVGATLSEMADIMIRLGCVDAMNLDGGGSTELFVNGVATNRPSDGTERKVANAILLFGPEVPTPVDANSFRFAGPAELKTGDPVELKIVEANGRQVPQTEIIWTAMGAAWVDQSGRIRAISAGKVTIRAYCRGVVVTTEILSTLPVAPTTVPPSKPK
ncbi:MAG: phosphodiester glycosidase family protein [Armatimonadetes bacterium]|nr:phosphodiester glycosidase family protein [Armatimonadota bacterium]